MGITIVKENLVEERTKRTELLVAHLIFRKQFVGELTGH
jgi:hypothetical protein